MVAEERNEPVSVPHETLEQYQRRRVADLLDLPPSEVTDEVLEQLMQRCVYPSARLDQGSEYGGYDNSHLTVVTRTELHDLERAVSAARQRLREEAKKQR